MKHLFRNQSPGFAGYAGLAAFAAVYLLLAGLVLSPHSLIGFITPQAEARHD